MNNQDKTVNMAIGFVTGRKNFKNLINTYVNNWNEYDLLNNDKLRLHLFVAYDLKYHNTTVGDYKKIDPSIYDLLDSVTFIGHNSIAAEIKHLVDNGVVNRKEASMVFGEGYAKKRNTVIYFALKNKMDYLLFLDDDEYPLALIKGPKNSINWLGQSVVSTHLRYIDGVDITHGHHCGYISPIPYIEFNSVLTENDFKDFIEAISNDIINWESIKSKMKDGGVTFADQTVIYEHKTEEVKEINKCKFVSGSNLCLNLRKAEQLAPFYNPPDARGEDTFFSTTLSKSKVLKVPCYTFHDGFLYYTHLLHGVLPKALKPINVANDPHRITSRFVRASIGWIRYKPLLMYIIRKDSYREEMENIKIKLQSTIPKLCEYFRTNDFAQIINNLDYYDRNVIKHFRSFEETKKIWSRIISYILHNESGAEEPDTIQQ